MAITEVPCLNRKGNTGLAYCNLALIQNLRYLRKFYATKIWSHTVGSNLLDVNHVQRHSLKVTYVNASVSVIIVLETSV